MTDTLRESDYWAVLGLEPGADAVSLKRAFREQARRWHPDLNGSDPVAEERFKQVNEAYAVLSDPRRRRAWEMGETQGSESTAAVDPFASGFPSFENYLDRLFGREGRAVGQPEAAAAGPEPSEQPSPVAESQQVPWSDGSAGGVTAAPPAPAPVKAAQDHETLISLTPEQALLGARVELELPDGLVVELDTPPLAGDGWRLRLAGVAPGGGDHFLHLRVRTADGLRIDGLRVLYPLELSPADAALGCQVVVPTLQGEVRLRIPAGSSSGRMLRLRGRGLAAGEQRGDQLVEVRIVVPGDLDPAEEALYSRLRQLASERDEGDGSAVAR
ncbi:MAG: DnaJ C-terminal domain-containing protein [Cyanobium sp.]